jgi:putative nucleotidyltransferase with HDIG domain
MLKQYFNSDNTLNWDFLHQQSWIQDMENCPQEPDWHAEGNVLIHTKMVINELQKLPAFLKLPLQHQKILLLAALFHDIGKPATTCVEDVRISAPKHARVGEKMTRNLLWDMEMTVREQICALVRLHGVPLWSLEKDNPNATVIEASCRVSNEWTWMLSNADVLGRICIDQNDLLERLEYFKELCLENECFYETKTFFNEHSRFKFFYERQEYPQYIFDDTSFEVILMCGIAGSGKDTYIKNLNLPVVSLDDLRKEMGVVFGDTKGQGHVIQKAYEMGKQFCAKKQSFIWNAMNLTVDLRMKLIRKFYAYRPKYRIIYIETSIENILERRSLDIPERHLLNMQQSLEFPMITEAHEVSYHRN